MKRSETQTMGSLLGKLFEEEPTLYENYLEHQALVHFRHMTTAFARFITSAKVQQQVLWVRVTTSEMRHVLLLDRERLRTNINQALGVELLREVVVSL